MADHAFNVGVVVCVSPCARMNQFLLSSADSQSRRYHSSGHVSEKDQNVTPHRTVAIETHGCKLNQADSEKLIQRFLEAGYKAVDPEDGPGVYIVNTCTVTHVADSKARQALRSARRKNPSALVVGTGCYAQRTPQELATLAEVDMVIGNFGKDRLVEAVLEAMGEEPLPHDASNDPSSRPIPQPTGRTRAMIKIQEGCNQVCAYCIVPKVRGRERSIPPELILNQVRQRISEGFKEVVLTGTQLGSYGFDLPDACLSKLVKLILDQTHIQRLRVSSLQPQEITPDLLKLWADSRLCPHFHLPLQSGSDLVLMKMRRRYTSAQYADAVDRIREQVSDVAITADVIVGFPGENDDQFLETRAFAETMQFASMHVFPYSSRPGTSAAYMGPIVLETTKRSRVREMLSLAREQASAYRSKYIGRARTVLWERSEVRSGRRVYCGMTENYLKVYTEERTELDNLITDAVIVADTEEGLLATVS